MGWIDMGCFLSMSPARLMINFLNRNFLIMLTIFQHLTLVVMTVRTIWNCVLILLEKFRTMKTIFILIVHSTNFNFIEKNICV